jgi:hypothetical protein
LTYSEFINKDDQEPKESVSVVEKKKVKPYKEEKKKKTGVEVIIKMKG